MEFNIKLQPEQINTIFAGLDELPHKNSRRVVDLILQQVQEQERASLAANAPAAPEPGLND